MWVIYHPVVESHSTMLPLFDKTVRPLTVCIHIRSDKLSASGTKAEHRLRMAYHCPPLRIESSMELWTSLGRFLMDTSFHTTGFGLIIVLWSWFAYDWEIIKGTQYPSVYNSLISINSFPVLSNLPIIFPFFSRILLISVPLYTIFKIFNFSINL